MTRKRTSENDLVVSGGGAAVPARRKTAVRPRAKHAAEPAESLAAAADAAPGYSAPSHQEIAALAYSYWETRGYQGGSPEEDWLRAEQELRVRAIAVVA